MFRAQDITIKHKLVLIITATSFLALFLVGASFSLWSHFSAKTSLSRNLSTQAEMIARNCRAAITFEDAEDAGDTLQSLSVIPSILYGAIYTNNGESFATYTSSSDIKVPSKIAYDTEGSCLRNGTLVSVEKIKLDSEVIGTVVLCSNLSPLKKMLARNIEIILALLAVASMVTYLISSKVQAIISGPILSLANVASVVSKEKDYSVRAVKNTNDEIGFLIDSFNYMLEQIQAEITDRKRAEEDIVKLNETLEQRVIMRTAELEKTHNQLMVASHRAGMAEVATDVLHNVGNILNSVNVQTTLILEKIKDSKITKIQEIAGMIEGHLDDISEYLKQDEKGRHIPQYLCDVTRYMVDEREDMLEKLSSLTNNVNHIKEIISMQQSYAKASDTSIITSISEVVDDAVQINHESLKRHGIKITRQIEDLGKLNIDRQRIVQILVNLIANAKHAINGNGIDEKNINIKSYRQRDECVIEVTDNGMGIPPESLTKIFGHGYTTKDDGHGFGLHSGALAAKEMNGSLMAYSEGLGKGATFKLVIPFRPAEVKNGS